MKTRLPVALAVAGIIGTGAIFTALSADAQQSPPASPNPPAAAAPEAKHPGPSAEDRAAFFDARIAALHAGLRLSPDQEKLWPAVETALRDGAKTLIAQREKMRSEPRPENPVQALQRLSEALLARGEALKKLADVAQPLYATLTDEQKHRLPILVHGLRPHFMWHHFAMMGEGPREHHGWGWWRGGRGDWDDHGPRHYDHDRDHDDDHGPGFWGPDFWRDWR